MTDDCKERNHPMKLRNRKIISLSKKKYPDDDSISSSIVDNDSIDSTSDEESELTNISYNKLVSTIAKLYPSKYNSCKTKTFNKRRINNNFIPIKNNKLHNAKKHKNNHPDKYNIIFTINEYNKKDKKINDNDKEDDENNEENEEKEEEEDEEDEEEEEEEEEEGEDEEEDEEEDEDEDEDEEEDEEDEEDEEEKDIQYEEINKILTNPAILKVFNKSINKLQNNNNNSTKNINAINLKKNITCFNKLLKKKQLVNDSLFFKQRLTYAEQCNIIEELKKIQKYSKIEKPYRLSIIELDIPIEFKACAFKKINQFRSMEPGCGEFYKIKNWVDTFIQIPFGVYRNLPINISDGIDKCHDFMENAKNQLDLATFGLNDAKLQIMQLIGQWISNPDAVGTAIAIHGPMGTGKTTLVKEGISKILNREFAFIALGGATDSSFLEGHSYTYEGSKWGQIVDILIRCKTMNPIIYFDELDKVSETPKGDEIIGILTHLIDISQNTKFHDKYFSEIEFDLSKCLFIFSYNDETKISPILRDRMYRINTKGYSKIEKTSIAIDYLLPKIREQVNFNEDQINIPTDIIQYVIDNFTNNECGVRDLKRCLEIIYTKLNLYRLMKPGNNIFEKEMSINIQFPFTMTQDILLKLLKKNISNSDIPFGMYN
jgi:ATP-dependent Lon protease